MAEATGSTFSKGDASPRPEASRPGSKILGVADHAVWTLLGTVLLLAVWSLISTTLGPHRLPPPVSLWPGFIERLYESKTLAIQGGGNRGLWPHLLYTVQQTLLGGAIGTAAGVMLALAMARWRSFFYFMDVPVGVLRTIPPLAAIPFMVLWLGPSQSAQLGVVVFYVGLMVTINAITAIRNLDPLVANFAKTLGADERRIYRTVILPSILPELAGGIRVAIGVAWGIEIVSELAGAPRGMGQAFLRLIAFQELDTIIIGIIWITIASLVVDFAITWTFRRCTRWAPQNEPG